MLSSSNLVSTPEAREQRVKCVVWDLDNTIWKGVLLEGDELILDEFVVETIKTLDERGILQSIASRNDPSAALLKMDQFGLTAYFLYPQINWNSKASSIAKISAALNLSSAQFCFVDDQPFELEEVRFSLPEVLCIARDDLGALLRRPEMTGSLVSPDSRRRRLLYMEEIERQKCEEVFEGTKTEFLATLDMSFSVSPVSEGDLQRAEELTQRTSQLNSTGYTYSYEDLEKLSNSPAHIVLIAELTDKFGNYGKIGLAVIETSQDLWKIKLLLMSCRVIARGLGNIMLNSILRMGRKARMRIQAEFIPSDRNRMMHVTFRLAGFHQVGSVNGALILEHELASIPDAPDCVRVEIKDVAGQIMQFQGL